MIELTRDVRCYYRTLYIDVRACDMYFYYCASLTCTVYMYINICILIYIYNCIVRSVTDARDNRSLGHRNARRAPPKENYFFFQRRSRTARERARSRVSRIRHSPFVESHTTFLRTTSLYRRHIEISFYSHSNRSQTRQRSTAHVYPRYQFLKIFLTRFRLTFSLRFDYLLGRLKPMANLSVSSVPDESVAREKFTRRISQRPSNVM